MVSASASRPSFTTAIAFSSALAGPCYASSIRLTQPRAGTYHAPLHRLQDRLLDTSLGWRAGRRLRQLPAPLPRSALLRVGRRNFSPSVPSQGGGIFLWDALLTTTSDSTVCRSRTIMRASCAITAQ